MFRDDDDIKKQSSAVNRRVGDWLTGSNFFLLVLGNEIVHRNSTFTYTVTTKFFVILKMFLMIHGDTHES